MQVRQYILVLFRKAGVFIISFVCRPGVSRFQMACSGFSRAAKQVLVAVIAPEGGTNGKHHVAHLDFLP